jgi:hypothetical protein
MKYQLADVMRRFPRMTSGRSIDPATILQRFLNHTKPDHLRGSFLSKSFSDAAGSRP